MAGERTAHCLALVWAARCRRSRLAAGGGGSLPVRAGLHRSGWRHAGADGENDRMAVAAPLPGRCDPRRAAGVPVPRRGDGGGGGGNSWAGARRCPLPSACRLQTAQRVDGRRPARAGARRDRGDLCRRAGTTARAAGCSPRHADACRRWERRVSGRGRAFAGSRRHRERPSPVPFGVRGVLKSGHSAACGCRRRASKRCAAGVECAEHFGDSGRSARAPRTPPAPAERHGGP
jgi:hypothetical protein